MQATSIFLITFYIILLNRYLFFKESIIIMAVNWLISFLFLFFVFLNNTVVHTNSQFIHIVETSANKEIDVLFTLVDYKTVVKQNF